MTDRCYYFEEIFEPFKRIRIDTSEESSEPHFPNTSVREYSIRDVKVQFPIRGDNKKRLAMEFLEKLNECADLEKQLSLALKAFSLHELPITKKEELILGWLVQCIQSILDREAVETNANNDGNIEKLIKSYDTLQACLACPRLKTHQTDIKRSLCDDIIKIIINHGYECEELRLQKISHKCVISILESPIFLRIFKQDIEPFLNLMAYFFHHTNNILEPDDDTNDLTLALRTISVAFRNSLLKNDFQSQFLKKTLGKIIATSIKLKNDTFDSEVSKCLQQIFFAAPHDYTTAMKDPRSDEHSTIIRILKFPKNNDPVIVAHFYHFFLSLFAKHRKNKNQTFEMFQTLAEVIGFEPLENGKDAVVKRVKGFKGTCTLLRMLSTLKDSNISLENETHSALLSKWLTSLLKSFLHSNASSECDELRLIKELFSFLDPVVIENLFPLFVSNVMLKNKTSNKLRNIYCQTLTEIFTVFEKLSRVNKFISKMMEAMLMWEARDKMCVALNDMFPEEFFRSFDKAVTKQPIGASVTSLTALRYYFEKILLPKMETAPISAEQEVLIDVILHLTSHLLSNMNMADDSVSTIVKEKFTHAFKELAVYLQRFGKALLIHEFSIRAAMAFFNLSYTWGALHLLMVTYNMEGKDLVEEQSNTDAINLSYVLHFLSDSEWAILTNRVMEKGDDEVKALLFKLMNQKMGALRLKGCDEPAVKVAHFLIGNAGTTWLCENANSLIYLLEKNELLQLSTGLLKCKDQDKLIALLKTEEFQENSDMVAAMSLSILWKIAGKLQKSGPSTLKNILLKFDLEMIVGDKADHEKMTDVLEDLAKILSKGLKKSPDDLCIFTPYIKKNIELLSILPLSFLKTNTQSGILFCLFAIAHCLEANTVLFDLIASILDSNEPLKLPETLDWNILIHSIYSRSEKYHLRDALIECLIKAASGSSTNIKKIVSSVTSSSNEENITISTIISQVFPKMMRNKRNADGVLKDTLQQCENDLRNCLRNVSNLKPELRWLQTFRAAIHYHLKPSCQVDANDVKKLFELVPSYLDLILNKISALEELDEVEKEENFLELILTNRKHFEIELPNDIATIWIKLAGRLPVQKLQTLLQLVNLDQFSCILESLKNITSPSTDEPGMTDEVFLLWKVLIIAQLNSSKKEALRKLALNHLSDVLLQLAFVWKKSGSVMNVHELLIAFAAAVKVEMTFNHVGMCLEVVNATPIDAEPEMLGRAVDLLSHLLRYRSALMLDHIPQLLQQMSHLIAALSRSSHLPDMKHPAQQLAAVAFSLEKLTNVMVADHKRHFARVAHHFVANVLRNFEEWTVEYTVKVHLRNVIFSFLSLCDQHTISFLMRCLPSTPQHMFKDIREQYKKYHAFTGRV